MKLAIKQIAMVAALATTLVGVGAYALVTSYGSISGQATVDAAITFDILETYSDVNTALTDDSGYVLETTYQAETKEVKLKIENKADVAIPANINVSGATADVTISLWDENKTAQLTNPISIPNPQLYIWIKHEFKPAASPGNYSFALDVTPA